MNYKAIVLDLDGTLLRNDKSISDYTIDILNRYSKVGKIILASGRAFNRIKPYADCFETAGIVANNGSIIYKGNDKIKQYDINPETIKELVVKLAALDDHDLSLWYPTKNVTDHLAYVKPNGPTYYTDFKDFEVDEIQKISIVTKHHDVIQGIDCDYFGCKLIENAKEPDFFVFINEKVSKKVGLTDLFKALELNPKEVIAFGDDYNDLEMFECCGKSVVVDNAIQPIKNQADEITLSNENDGVAHYINKYLLD